MSQRIDLALIAANDGRFPAEAFQFVADGLARGAELAGKDREAGKPRHLSARELVQGCTDLAAERWSALAELVLRDIGIHSPLDIGEITFVLIDHGVFTKEPHDRLEDFQQVGPLTLALDHRMRERAGV